MALNTDISKGVFDRFRSLPIWRPAVLVGMLLADAVRYTLASIVIISLGVALGFRPDGGAARRGRRRRPAAGVLLQPVVGVDAIGLKLQTPESVMQTSMTVLFPLTFASNVFVDPSTMPGWVQAFVRVNPVSQLTTRVPGPHARHRRGHGHRLGARLERGPRRGVRPAHDAAVQRRAIVGGADQAATVSRRGRPGRRRRRARRR